MIEDRNFGERRVGMSRASDIERLEQTLNNAGTFDELSEKAIRIHKRLNEEQKKVLGTPDREFAQKHLEESKDFERVKKMIIIRRGEISLKQYEEFRKCLKGRPQTA